MQKLLENISIIYYNIALNINNNKGNVVEL